MAVYLSPFGGVGAQFFDNSGIPLTGGKIYTYSAGTTTPAPTYTTFMGNVAHTNPIVLDSAGRIPAGGEVWLDITKSYKFVMKTSTDVLIGTWDNISGPGALVFIVDNFNGNGTSQAFTLTAAPYDENVTFVYINGVYQNKNTYSVSGTTLTFSEAPPSNSTIEVMYLQVVQNVGLNNFTGTGSVTAFTLTVAPFSENSTFVFINGVYQQKNTYTVVGTTLTFSEAPPNASSIEVVFT
jgi:hypothetical protein